MGGRLEMLRNALEALAAEADHQIEYLEEMDVCSDELALDYDGIAAAAYDMLEQGEIDRHQCECVKSLNEMLGQISGPANAKLWTDAALISSPEWRAIRDSAKKCLALLQ